MKTRIPKENLTSRCLSVGLMILALLAFWPAGAHARARCPDPDVSDTSKIMICVRVIEADVHRKLDADPDLILFTIENEADCRVCVDINGEWAGCTRRIDGADEPEYNEEFCLEVPRDLERVPISIDCADWDGLGGFQQVDLDPNAGDRILDLEFDPCENRVYGDGIDPDDPPDGGSPNWYGDGDVFQRDGKVKLEFYLSSRMSNPPDWYDYGDLLMQSVDLVQVLERATFAVADHPAVLRVVVSSSFDELDGISVDTDIYGWIDDGEGMRVTTLVPIHLDHCDVETLYLFDDAPVMIGDVSSVWYGAHIDTANLYQDPSRPECVDLNDSSPLSKSMEVWNTRDLSIVFFRYRHPEDFEPMFSQAEAEAEVAIVMDLMDGTYPAPFRIEHEVLPNILTLGWNRFTGPWDEIATVSALCSAVGIDRAVGLVESTWFEFQDYATVPGSASGVSNGKIAPNFVIVEMNGQGMWATPHEIGHTFGLSAQPCECVVEVWNCYDEYETDCFEGEPYRGRGFYMINQVPVGGICFMDNETASWIDNTCYKELARQLRNYEDPRVLVVKGKAMADSGGEVDWAFGVEEGTPDRTVPGPSPFKLVLRDSLHTTLGEYSIFPTFRDSNDDGIVDGDVDGDSIPDYFGLPHATCAKETAYFSLAVPWVEEATELALAVADAGGGLRSLLTYQLVDVDVVQLSETAIGIEILEPESDVLVEPGDSVTVRWQTTEDPPHGVLIALSFDGGETFVPAMEPVTGTASEAVLDMKGIEEPVFVKIRVFSLQDGLLGMDTTDDIPPNYKWVQMPDLTTTGLDVAATYDYILADDFPCTESGRITEIYVWASWFYDLLPYGGDPTAVDFVLSFHEDIPESLSSAGYSMPGDVLWYRTFVPGEFEALVYADSLVEGWLDPPTTPTFPADSTCWLYKFTVDRSEAFYQGGTAGDTVVYWLDVQAMPHDWPTSRFGWKVSVDHWNDDAVWGVGAEPYPGPWWELLYPPSHPYYPASIDLAFSLVTEPMSAVPGEKQTPQSLDLRQNMPNPFTSTTAIRYSLAALGHVNLQVFDVRGRLVATLVDEVQQAGWHTVEWSGRNSAGRELPSGIYFCRLSGGNRTLTRKMILLR